MSLPETSNKQIEVELQFECTPNSVAIIELNATLIKEKVLDEIYYDTDDYSLFCNDSALRLRNGNYEFKIRRAEQRHGDVEVYEEYAGEAAIRKVLDPDDIYTDLAFIDFLQQVGYAEKVHMITTRKTYTQDSFTIDIDFTDFNYIVVEIETMVSSYSETESAKQKIIDYANKIGMPNARARSKLKEYIVRFIPNIAKILIEKGMIV
jgi:adenylate cyclase class IV